MALVDDWSGRLAGGDQSALRSALLLPLLRDPLTLVVPRGHPAAGASWRSGRMLARLVPARRALRPRRAAPGCRSWQD